MKFHDCPFCGYDDIGIDEIEIGIFSVFCPECECIGPTAPEVMTAIEQWNKGAEMAAMYRWLANTGRIPPDTLTAARNALGIKNDETREEAKNDQDN